MISVDTYASEVMSYCPCFLRTTSIRVSGTKDYLKLESDAFCGGERVDYVIIVGLSFAGGGVFLAVYGVYFCMASPSCVSAQGHEPFVLSVVVEHLASPRKVPAHPAR